MWQCILIKFLVIKPSRCTDSSKLYFGMKFYMFRTVPLSIIRSFSLYTRQWYMSYRFVDSLRAGSRWNCGCNFNLTIFLRLHIHFINNLTLSTTVWQIPDAVNTVVYTPDDGWRSNPKYVKQFPDINKLCNFVYCWTHVGKSQIIRTMGTCFAVGYTAGWVWQNTHGLLLSYHCGAGVTLIVHFCHEFFFAINMDTPNFICTKEEQRAVINFCGLKVYLVSKCIEWCQCSMGTVSQRIVC
jgi:hypothetical protein